MRPLRSHSIKAITERDQVIPRIGKNMVLKLQHKSSLQEAENIFFCLYLQNVMIFLVIEVFDKNF